MARIDRTPVGIGIVDPRWTEANISAAHSSFTEEGPRPGGAKAQNNLQDGLPVITGAQAQDVAIKVTKSGNPSIAERGAAVAWKPSAAADTNWRGWSGPQFPSSYRPILRTGNAIRDIDAATVPSTQAVVVTAHDTANVYARATSGSSFEFGGSASVVATTARASSVCTLPDDTILVFTADSGAGLRAAYASTNGGASYTLWTDEWCPEGIASGTPAHFRVRYHEGQLIAVYETSSGITTYSSADLGQTFRAVSTFTGAATGLTVTKAGTAIVSYTDATDLIVKRLGASFARADSAPAITVSAGTVPIDTSLHCDDDGRIYLISYVNDNTYNHRAEIRVSDDDGLSWRLLDNSPIGQSQSGAVGTFVSRFQMTTADGQGFIVGAYPDDTAGDIVGCHIVSGWTNLVNGSTHSEKTRLGAVDTDYIAQGTNTSGIDTNTSLTHTFFARGAHWDGAYGFYVFPPFLSAPTFTATTDDAYLTVTGTGTLVSNFGATYTNGDPVVVTMSLKKVADASGIPTGILMVGRDAAGNKYAHSLTITTVGLTLIGSPAHSIDMTVYRDLVVVINGATARLYIRTATHKTYDLAVTNTVASGILPHNSNFIHINGALGNRTDYRMVSVYCGGQDMRWAGDGAHQMIGKRIAANGYPLLNGGSNASPSRLSLAGGFCRQLTASNLKTWDIEADHDYPVSRIFSQSPSPDERWRSASAAQQTIVCDFGKDTALDEAIPFMLVRGANFREIEFKGQTSGGAATTLYTADLAVLSGAAYSLTGDILTPTAVNVHTARFFGGDELVGGYAALTSGGTTVYRKIVSNRSGNFDSATSVVSTVRIEGITGAEPATGTLALIAPEALIMLPEYTGTKFQHWGAVIKTTDLSESFVSAGSIILGSVVVPGKRWGNGWTMRTEPNVERVADSSGTLTVRQKGPNRRILSWSWGDGMIQKRFRGSAAASADHVAAGASTTPVAVDQDVWLQMRAVVDRAKGGQELVVACLSVPAVNTTITDKTLYVAGFLDTGFQVAQVSGDSGVDEFIRVESMTLTEAV